MENSAKDNLLRSWKEIAAYLGYDQRTCYRWEQRFGMPVHRAEGGGSKSHVVAYKDELDRWFQATFTNSSRPAPPKPAPRPSARWLLAGLIPLAAAAVFLIVSPSASKDGQPADFHLRGSTLIILAENGKEIWRKDLKIDDLDDEASYRARFQTVDLNSTAGDRLPVLAIKDIDGDGRNEVLFAVRRRQDRYGRGIVFCFDNRGVELWRFVAGGEMRFGGRSYSPDYRISGFATHDFSGNGRLETAVISNQFPQWPCQLALLDCRGRKLGEFWNSGYLRDIAFQDIDGDGRDEIVAVGINNQYGPCLAVFDPGRVSGCSPQSGEFRSDTLPPGSEEYYLTFPRSDVSLARGDGAEGFQDVGITANKHLMANTVYNMIFELGFDLRCLYVDWGHGFVSKHEELRTAGKVPWDLDDAYRRRMKEGIRYWDGSRLVVQRVANLGIIHAERLGVPPLDRQP